MQELIEKFFLGLGIELTSITLREESDDLYVSIETPDSPLVIGMHGKNIEIFSHLLSRMCEKKIGHFVHFHLEVNDYMKAKEERLYKFLDSKIEYAQETGKTLKIPNLTPYERKKAHNYIGEKHIAGLTTKSDGEGSERALYIGYTGTLKLQNTLPPKNTEARINHLSEDGIGI